MGEAVMTGPNVSQMLRAYIGQRGIVEKLGLQSTRAAPPAAQPSPAQALYPNLPSANQKETTR
jgi:hypothetical protein